jgi:DNA repair protein RadC
MSDHLIKDAMAALGHWLQRDGLPTFDTRAAVTDAAMRLHDSDVELMLVYWLDGKRRLIQVDEVARGGETEATVSSRHIARRAALVNADSAVVVHNHPTSGDPTPSDADRECAQRIDQRLSALGVLVIGHHVVARGGFADIRTGHIARFDELAERSTPTEHRCPTCSQAWPTKENEREH